MSELFEKPRTPDSATSIATNGPAVIPIDEATTRHLSQTYWDWQAAFDRDPSASPLQHPDFVLAELSANRTPTHLDAALVRETCPNEQSTLGVLIPKSIRTSQVGGVGPAWRLNGYRLAGGHFLGAQATPEQIDRLLRLAISHASDTKADFLLIEDLDVSSQLYRSVQEQASRGSELFVSHDFQPRRYIDFPVEPADYWKTFSSRSLSKFRRNLKKFGQTQLERVTELDQIPEFLQSAHEISQQSWQSRQFGLRIRNDDAELRQLSALAQHGLLRSYLWRVEGKPAAFAVCNQHGGCFRYEEIAFRAEFSQFSPGRTMLHQIVDDLLRHNPPQSLDFGGGDAEYKQQFANRESRSGTVWLVPSTWHARWSVSYLKACRRVRHVARTLIKSSGLGTKARQWVRSVGASKAPASISSAACVDECRS